MNKNSVDNMKGLKEKKILVRCDFNVPIKDGIIQDDTRIRAAIPTIKYLLDNGAKVILCSHMGKPKPKEMTIEEMKEKFTLEPVAKRLEELLEKKIEFSNELTGEETTKKVNELNLGDVLLLENTRFDVRETKNDETLSLELANLADGYVNDAFGTAHRAHASTEGVASRMKEQGKETALGFLMQKEVEKLSGVLENPEHPVVVILGGAKVSDKIGVITNLMKIADKIIIGGKMANTFLKAKGYEIGSSGYEEDKIDIAKEILQKAEVQNVKICLPVDVHIAKIPEDVEFSLELAEKAEDTFANIEEGVPEGYTILDIGEDSSIKFTEEIENCKDENNCANTIIWNGPMGLTEVKKYAKGTENLAKFIANNTNAKCIVGGGDSVAAINKVKKEILKDETNNQGFERFHLSTGGGASLEFLEGKLLPGIDIIENKD